LPRAGQSRVGRRLRVAEPEGAHGSFLRNRRLPNVGKSTIFNALTRSSQALAANYPFATIEPNVGEVPVPDERLAVLQELVSGERIVPATVRFVDIAGLVRGASTGQGSETPS